MIMVCANCLICAFEPLDCARREVSISNKLLLEAVIRNRPSKLALVTCALGVGDAGGVWASATRLAVPTISPAVIRRAAVCLMRTPFEGLNLEIAGALTMEYAAVICGKRG